MNPKDSRRFGGIERLYGQAAFEAITTAHVCVVGLGGVGSWCAEALARSGVGTLTLVDGDTVAESNINRQLPALETRWDKPKPPCLPGALPRSILKAISIRLSSSLTPTI